MNDDIGYLIKQLSDRLKASGDAKLKEYGLTFSQLRVLHCIADHGGRCMQKDIENMIGVSHPAVVGLVSRLEASGYVNCSIDPDDRRNKIVSSTEKADKMSITFIEGRDSMEREMLSVFEDDEICQMKHLLRMLLDRMIQMEK